MKKIIALALAVVLMFSLCSCKKDDDIPFDECKQIAIGLWEDPLDEAPPFMVNEDGTAVFNGENYTWDVTFSMRYISETQDAFSYDSFYVSLFDDEGNEIYDVRIKYDYADKIWCVVGVSSEAENIPEYRYKDTLLFKEGSIEVIYLNDYNFGDYFELNQIFEWDTIEKKDWSCNAYICVKPEFEERVIQTNWKDKFYCDVEFNVYYVSIDKENDDINQLGLCDWQPENNINTKEMEMFINKWDSDYHGDYLAVDWVHMFNNYDDNGEFLEVAEYYSISGLDFILILKK